jgi:hypothetical protein
MYVYNSTLWVLWYCTYIRFDQPVVSRAGPTLTYLASEAVLPDGVQPFREALILGL